MTQFPSLTSETEAIVRKYFAQPMALQGPEPGKRLMASLYSLMPGADPKVLMILDRYIGSLSEVFSETDIDKLKSEFPAVVRYCFDNKGYSGILYRMGRPSSLPQSLLDLCMKICDPKPGKSVFVPFAGDGCSAYYFSDCRVEGFEKDEDSWAFSLILLSSQSTISANIILGDAYIPEKKCYDYIISFPPILGGIEDRKIIDFFHKLITEHLADEGKFYCLLPMSFCSEWAWLKVRNILSEYQDQFGAMVISLPREIFPYSNIGYCLLVVQKTKNSIVVLVDATNEEFMARGGDAYYKEFELKSDAIIETVLLSDEKHVWVGKPSQLTGSMNLQPSRYLISQIIPQPKSGELSIKLSDVIQDVKLIRKDKLEGQSCPLVGMKELSASYLNCDIERDSLETSRQGISSRILTSDCLLVGFIGGKFKVGRLHGVSPNSPVALRNEIHPFRVSSDKITEEFLLRCIMSEQAESQANKLSIGTTISRISRQDFLSITICVPNLMEQQDALCKEDTRRSLTEADRKIIESYEDFRKDMHMKKHAIGQTLFNLNNWWDALQQARKEGNGVVSDDATIGKVRKISVASIYDSMQKTINQLQQQIEKFDRGNGLVAKEFALTEFIEDYINRKECPLFIFDFYPTFNHRFWYVLFAPEALEIILDNIVSNACSHGFKGIANDKNRIRIHLKSEGNCFVVVVSNNGTAIHGQIKPDEVFVYGKTSKMGKSSDKKEHHFGIGGYEVQKLMHEFGGKAEFISNPESEFPVSYMLTFNNSILKRAEL